MHRSSATVSATAAIAVALVASSGFGAADTPASTSRPAPRAVETCSSINGPGGSPGDYKVSRNLVVGPFLLRDGRSLDYVAEVGGNKIFVLVKRGHRVTLELPRLARRDVGLVFRAQSPSGRVTLRGADRSVALVACRRGERSVWGDWPVSGWVGFLLATSPRCVPLLVWVDGEPSPRRTVLRFGVRACG